MNIFMTCDNPIDLLSSNVLNFGKMLIFYTHSTQLTPSIPTHFGMFTLVYLSTCNAFFLFFYIFHFIGKACPSDIRNNININDWKLRVKKNYPMKCKEKIRISIYVPYQEKSEFFKKGEFLCFSDQISAQKKNLMKCS